MFGPIEDLLEQGRPPTVGDLVAAAVEPVSGEITRDAANQPVSVDELLRCAVQAWGDLLRHEGLRHHAAAGFDHVGETMAAALRRGQEAATVPADLDPASGTRVAMALLHGFVLQRTAFGLDDTQGFVHDVRTILDDLGACRRAREPPSSFTLAKPCRGRKHS
ncbi:MAG: putative transcriptional regulator, TetR family [Mycobacterium sp.]|jgi:hypothetical protein|nr:putative transcriptional regulator, TetR family [Mycobacterium sp.]